MMGLKFTSLLCASALTPLLPYWSAAALAQTMPSSEGAEVAEEIVVTARKREERLLDIPETVSVLSSEDLVERGVTTIDDLGRQTPNIALSRRQDNEPNVVIRGVGAYGNTQGVGFYIDNVQNFTDQTMRLEDVSRVEILKGPQGTLYGGSNIGGAIRYISHRPAYLPEASISVEGGELGYWSAYGAVTGPIIDDKLAFRISAYRSQGDGFVHNPNLDIDQDRFVEWGTRAQLLYEPTPSFDALLTLRYGYLRNGGNPYVATDSVDNVLYDAPLSEDAFNRRKTFGSVLELNYDIGRLTLTSISSFTRRDGSFLWDGDYTADQLITGYSRPDNRPAKVYTQELRLASPDNDRFDWILGLYGSRVDNLGANATDVFLFGNLVSRFRDVTTRSDQVAAFGTANYHLGSLTLGAGLRVARAEYSSATNAFFGIPVGTSVEVNDTYILPKASMSYKLNPDAMIYISASKGYEPGKTNADAFQPTPYKAETAVSYELGLKGRTLNGALSYEFAGFYITYNDRQFETRRQDPVFGIVEGITNIGRSESLGLEASTAWRVNDALSFAASAGYLHSTWDDNAFFGVDDGAGGVIQIPLDGKRVPNAPEWTANLAADYEVPVGAEYQVGLHLDASYVGEFAWDLLNSPVSGENPSYWLGNARVAFGRADGKWEVAVRAENLFDEGYFTEFYPGFFGPQLPDGGCDVAGGGTQFCHEASPGQPRRLVASLRARF